MCELLLLSPHPDSAPAHRKLNDRFIILNDKPQHVSKAFDINPQNQ